MLDIFLADLCDMHQTILMHADIDKRAEIHYVSNRSGQFHTDGQILDIFDIAADFSDRNILTRVTSRLEKLYVDILQGRGTDLKLPGTFIQSAQCIYPFP